MRLAFELIAIAILLGINAFLAALRSRWFRSQDPDARARRGRQQACRVLELVETPARFLAIIQIGITMAGFFAAAFGAVTLSDKFEDVVDGVPVGFIEENAAASP